MPDESQFTGARCSFEYVGDDGTTYLLVLDVTLGSIPELGLNAAVAGTAGIPLPRGLRPRVIFWQAEEGNRKELVVAAESDLYSTTTPMALTIDGVLGRITGRRGERFTMPCLAQVPAAGAGGA